MARQHRFDTSSLAVATASAACIALLSLPLACQSDADDADNDAVEDGTTATQSSSGMVNPSARDEGRTPSSAPETPAGAPADGAQPAAAQGTTPVAPDEPPDSPAAGDLGSPPAAPALVFEACTYREGTYGRNCDSIYVTMKQLSPPRCVQLTLDNCGEYGRQGLPVNVPLPWRLESGAVSSNLNECELGVFYPSSSVALNASGSVTWSAATRLPSEIAVDVTLETSSTPSAATSVEVTTAAPINPVVCDD